jgi:Uma2 family endonuclease
MDMAANISVPRYTIGDLEDFPEDGNRYELLDGVLLVTPQASLHHQTVASHLMFSLYKAVDDLAWVVGPAAVEKGNRTHLEPDVLVFPKHYSPKLDWRKVKEHWLVIEVLSRSSKMYDRDFKRDAYLKIGAREVWIVDRDEQIVEVSTEPGKFKKVSSVIRWRVPGTNRIAPIDVRAMFKAVE